MTRSHATVGYLKRKQIGSEARAFTHGTEARERGGERKREKQREKREVVRHTPVHVGHTWFTGDIGQSRRRNRQAESPCCRTKEEEGKRGRCVCGEEQGGEELKKLDNRRSGCHRFRVQGPVKNLRSCTFREGHGRPIVLPANRKKAKLSVARARSEVYTLAREKQHYTQAQTGRQKQQTTQSFVDEAMQT